MAEARQLPRGVRPVASLRAEEAAGIGEEASDLVALAAHGVPLADGWLVSLRGEDRAARLRAAVDLALGRSARVRLRTLFPSRVVASRLSGRPGLSAQVGGDRDVDAVLRDYLDTVSAPPVIRALGGNANRLHVHVVAVGEGTVGRAASADPHDGDPEVIHVWQKAVAPWRLDRRTARITAHGEGTLETLQISQVADLADRAQLALGAPVEIGWARLRDRMVVTSVRPLALHPAFTAAPFRIVVLLTADEGTVAPLAIDALDKALREGDSPTEEPRVQRIFARPYRRMDQGQSVPRRSADPASLARAAARAARVAANVATPIAASRRFARALDERLAALDAEDLRALDDPSLMRALRERQRLVSDALALLDAGRLATVAVLTALEAAVGALPRECFPALARPRPSRSRRRMHDHLARLARKIESETGELVGPARLSPDLRRRWDDLRRELAAIRPVGIDVTPESYGCSDRTLLEALRAGLAEEDGSRERARRNAVRRVLATARSKPLGRSREAIAASLTLVANRVARAKGTTAENLASALLRLRAAACEAGHRLVRQGLVDHPEDALYLYVDEIGQGLMGEPGAYAARVRLRREDDLRWRHFHAPRRIAGRRSTRPGSTRPGSA